MNPLLKKATVGVSSRTPYKHWLYNHHLGAMVGAASTGKASCERRAVVLDLCAGDGVATYDESGKPTSSPAIALRHTTSNLYRHMPREAHLFERQRSTYDTLAEGYDQHETLRLHCMDSSCVRVGDYAGQRSAVFVYADPNSINTMPINQDMVDSFTPTTLFLLTLGCNVGGLKRMSLDDRQPWFDMVTMVMESKRDWHDLQLIWLERDDSQWAYMLSVPLVWEKGKDKLAKAISAGNKIWPKGVNGVSIYRHGIEAFNDKIGDLFLTQKEKQSA